MYCQRENVAEQWLVGWICPLTGLQVYSHVCSIGIEAPGSGLQLARYLQSSTKACDSDVLFNRGAAALALLLRNPIPILAAPQIDRALEHFTRMCGADSGTATRMTNVVQWAQRHGLAGDSTAHLTLLDRWVRLAYIPAGLLDWSASMDERAFIGAVAAHANAAYDQGNCTWSVSAHAERSRPHLCEHLDVRA